MTQCCDNDTALETLQQNQRGTLYRVLGINSLMFAVMVAAALYGRSTALLADSLDNLGDALTYGLSLYAVAGGSGTKARVALVKGGLILLAGLAVLGQVVYRLVVPAVPLFEVMGIFSLLALAANSVCFLMLRKHRHEDINMSSVWECSRNDIATNLSVFIAAAAVWLTGSGWPDILVALALVTLLLRSAVRVISSAMTQLRAEAG